MYDVDYSPEARALAASLPSDAKRALADAIEGLRRAPWSGEPYQGHPPEFRTWPFGAWGLIVYLIRQQRETVVVLALTWAA